jgi:regulator of sirC expression with transglutaminase-like and TPR domain
MFVRVFLFFLLYTSSHCFSAPINSHQISSLYQSLDPLSITQNLAFYELYPTSKEGKLSLQNAWRLLCGEGIISSSPLTLPKVDMQAIISLITKQPSDLPVFLSEEQLGIMQRIGSSLCNRKLQGFLLWKEEEILKLPSEEIDLARALLVSQFGEEKDHKKEILQYEASLDLMALQIKARLPLNASSEEKIHKINHFIFQEMGFRFPPHSLYANDIDLYTFLPSVLDSRKGVCLGVSMLYLCLAQRLDLSLEIVTPPGHIYLRYSGGEEVLNIETTARGIHLPSDVYLGINTRSLQTRSIKEVVGLSFMNGAAVSFGKMDYKGAVNLYERARPYLPDDPLLHLFLGMNYLFIGKKQEGKKLLTPLSSFTFDYAVSPETMAEDFLQGRVSIEGLQCIFLSVDEMRSSILQKQEKLQKILQSYPKFRAGLLQLATTYLQLGKTADALDVLLQYHAIDPNDATTEYYLAALCLERFDYPLCWKFLTEATRLTKARSHNPKALRALELEIRRNCPNPLAENL